MYLGAKIFQCILQDGDDADLKPYMTWLERFDRLCITSNNDRVLEDLAGRLSGALEVRTHRDYYTIPTGLIPNLCFLDSISEIPRFKHQCCLYPLTWNCANFYETGVC